MFTLYEWIKAIILDTWPGSMIKHELTFDDSRNGYEVHIFVDNYPYCGLHLAKDDNGLLVSIFRSTSSPLGPYEEVEIFKHLNTYFTCNRSESFLITSIPKTLKLKVIHVININEHDPETHSLTPEQLIALLLSRMR